MGTGEPTKIIFGTDGWRAKIGDEFTYENVRRLAEGVARVVEQDGTMAKGVVIAYDRRFGSEDFAVTAAEILLGHNIPVAYAHTAVPTQMASYEVVERGAAMGVVITASHNPWLDNGFKVKAPSGAAAGPDLLKRIETEIAKTRGPELSGRPFADAEAAGLVERYDPYPGYKKFVERNLDLAQLAAQPLSIMVDPVYGAGAGWIGRLLAGGKLRVTEMRSERNPWFGGVNPEPIRPHIDPVLDAMRGGGYDLGLLLDGDADRAGAVTEQGVFIHQLQAFGLLAYYMLEHKKDLRPIVKTVNESSMGERLGAHYGVEVFETPVGFKYVGPKMIETGASMGGEESGGYGFAMHLPERDGIFADLLILDLLVRERAHGRKSMSEVLAHVQSIGGESHYLRIDVHIPRGEYPAVKERLATQLVAAPPSTLGAHPVRAVPLSTKDGVKFFTADDSWLLVRFSGTEPLVRVYAEATSAALRDELLTIGEKLARG
jgi:phosphomannomutase